MEKTPIQIINEERQILREEIQKQTQEAFLNFTKKTGLTVEKVTVEFQILHNHNNSKKFSLLQSIEIETLEGL